jgi:hypothetical protein
VSYTPTAGYNGSDTFTYTGFDAGGTSGAATVTITIPPPPPPACGGVSVQTSPGGSTVTIPFSCTASAAAGPITYAIVSSPKHGTLGAVNQSTHAVNYTPKKNYVGQDTFTYKGTAAGEDSSPATVTVTVPAPPKLGPTMTWSFGLFKRYTTVLSMGVNAILPGAKVVVVCSGKGCKHKSHTVSTPTSKRTCKKGKKCTRTKLKSASVDLTRYFTGWHLGIGSHVTVSIVKSGYIGKVYIFGIRGPKDPSVKITCVAPGSNAPGKGC